LSNGITRDNLQCFNSHNNIAKKQEINGFSNNNSLENMNLNEKSLFNNDDMSNYINHDQFFTKNLHQTLKSILPNANISFGNFTNNINSNKSFQFNNSFQVPVQISNSESSINNQWPEDPAIVSLTDKFNSIANGSGFCSNGNEFLLNKNQNNFVGSLSSNNNFNKNINKLNSVFENQKLNNNQQQPHLNFFSNNHTTLNSESQLSENANSQYFNKFLEETNNMNFNKISTNCLNNINNNAIKPQLNTNSSETLNQQLNLLKNLNTFSNSNSNFGNPLHLMGQNNQFTLLNATTNNNNLSLQQQFFMQQLAANLSANNKMSNE
jgi:hypothetical protein